MNTFSSPFAAFVVITLASLGGCNAPGQHPGAPVVDTLATGLVVVDNTPLAVRADTAPWSLIEEVRIGAVEGAGPSVFGDIYFFAVDDEGRIYILDGQAQEIRLFSADGETTLRERTTVGTTDGLSFSQGGGPELIPQSHGGALLSGGKPGNAGGRVAAERRRARAERSEAVDDAMVGHIEKLSTIIGNLVEEAGGEQYRCPQCGSFGPKVSD